MQELKEKKKLVKEAQKKKKKKSFEHEKKRSKKGRHQKRLEKEKRVRQIFEGRTNSTRVRHSTIFLFFPQRLKEDAYISPI